MRFRSGCYVPAFFLFVLCRVLGYSSGMENAGRYVVEQYQYDEGVRVVVRREGSGVVSRLGVSAETFSALAVLLIAGCGVAAALMSVVAWNATLWALGCVVASVVLCVLVAGFSGRGKVASSGVVVDHVFGVEGGFGPGLEDLLNDVDFGPDTLSVMMQAGHEDDAEVIAVMNRIWRVYRKRQRVGRTQVDVLGDVSSRMNALESAIDDVDVISRRSSLGD